jgi:flavin reductase (DIM6/NTAB) family NADH-FMN oxidoreductase RutF
MILAILTIFQAEKSCQYSPINPPLKVEIMSKFKEPKFKSIDPETAPFKEIHSTLLGGVTPRPIALVSTISVNGINNLAPFSFYNIFSANPPYLGFSPTYSGSNGQAKDTLNNLRNIPECVVNAVSHAIIEQVNLASAKYAPDVDEFIKCGFSPIDSDIVKAKRVKESPFQMECRAEQIILLGESNGSGNLILCKVLKIHVDEKVMKKGIPDPQLIDLVGRNSANYYTRASGSAVFEINKPEAPGIGIDQLPKHIQKSRILSANNLGQLGGIEKLPEQSEIMEFINSFRKTELTTDETDILETKNYQITCGAGFSLASSDRKKAHELIETAAKKALDVKDIDFAIKALLSIEMV